MSLNNINEMNNNEIIDKNVSVDYSKGAIPKKYSRSNLSNDSNNNKDHNNNIFNNYSLSDSLVNNNSFNINNNYIINHSNSSLDNINNENIHKLCNNEAFDISKDIDFTIPDLTINEREKMLNIEKYDEARYARKNKLLDRSSKKLGDNSVVATGNSECHVLDIPSCSSVPSNFYSSLQSYIKTPNEDIAWNEANHAYRIRSRVFPGNYSGLVTHPNIQESFVSTSLPNGSDVAAVTLAFTAPLSTPTIPIESLGAFAPNGLLNTKAFENIMIAPLNAAAPARRQVVMALSDYWNRGRIGHENSTFYAKLTYYAMLRQRFADEAIVPAIAPHQAANRPTHVNMSVDANFTVAALSRPIVNRETTLVFEYGYSRANYKFYNLITHDGQYFAHPPDTRLIPGFYYNIPGIALTILANDDAPDAPNVNPDLSAHELWDFAYRFAADRGEWSALKRGIQMASDLALNNTLPNRLFGPNAGRQYRVINPYFEMNDPGWPLPTDVCWFYRLTNIVQSPDIHMDSELNAFSILTTAQINLLLSLRVLFIRCIMTTILYNLNITGTLIQLYVRNSPLQPASIVNLWNTPLFMVSRAVDPNTGYSKSATIFDIVRDNIYDLSGLAIDTNYFNGKSWNYPRYFASDLSEDNHYYGNICTNYTFRMDNLLSIDQWLRVRPLSWGISLPNPKANFNKEIISRGPANRRGYYTHLGDINIAEGYKSKHPYVLQLYIPMAINTITQGLRDRYQRLHLRFCRALWEPNSPPMWDYAVQYEHAYPYLNILHMYGLCTIMTYNWLDDTIVAPMIREIENAHVIGAINAIQDQIVPLAGLGKETAAIINEVKTVFSFDFGRINISNSANVPAQVQHDIEQDFQDAA